MFADWLQERCRVHAEECAIHETVTGWRVRFGELPELLRRRSLERGWLAPGWLACMGTTEKEAVLDLLAGAWAGLWVCPFLPRWPAGRISTWWKALLPRELAQSAMDAPSLQFLAGPVPEGAGGTVLATSGSSGIPKAVFHRWADHIAAAELSCGPGQRVDLQPGDSWALEFSPAHVSGLGVLLRCLAHGATIMLGPPFSVTHRSLVFTTLRRALDPTSPTPPPAKVALLGGGPIPGSLLQAAIRQGWPVQTTYGMTETSAQFCTSEVWSGAEAASLPSGGGAVPVGKVLPGREMRTDEDGRILLRGAGLFLGYGQGGAVTQSAGDEDGWFVTGDHGSCSAEGVWTIHGRCDRRFKCGGENISPEAIETALLSLPGVESAAVLPVPDPEYGLRPLAFLQGEGSVAAWRSQLREKVSGLEMPVRWLRWPEASATAGSLDTKWSREFFAQILASEADGAYRLPEHS
jgi:O-succinylbenzoic acid--CoA ligase